MWAKVEKDTKRGKRKWKTAELFADERCSEAILMFLRTTDVGRKVPVAKAETESSESGAEQECSNSCSGGKVVTMVKTLTSIRSSSGINSWDSLPHIRKCVRYHALLDFNDT